jgi:hypothetical protein
MDNQEESQQEFSQEPQQENEGGVMDSLNSMKDSMTENLNEDAVEQESASAPDGFMESNGFISKMGFILIVVIVFMILMNLGIYLIGFFTSPSNNVYLLNGQLPGNKDKIIKQNPNDKSSKMVKRSNNEDEGIEFTWSTWLLYNVIDGDTSSTYRPVFIKGDGKKHGEYSSVNHGPGVYFGPGEDVNSNTLYILMDTVANPATRTRTNTEIIKIDNLPISKYFHLAIRCKNKYIDVYVNGSIVFRNNLVDVPKQNYYDVHISQNGGFSGYISNLQYFEKALTITELNRIVNAGPNLNNADKETGKYGSTYLSNLWYNSFIN